MSMSRQFSGWTWFFCFLPMWGMLILLEIFVGEHFGLQDFARKAMNACLTIHNQFYGKKNPKSCMYQYYHPKPNKMPVFCSIWFFFRLLSLWSTIYDTEWCQPFHLLQAGAKHTSKKKHHQFPRANFHPSTFCSPTSKITTKKGGYVKIQMIDFRSNNPSTHGELIAFCYDVVFGAAWQRWTGKFQRTIVNLLPKTKGKVMKFAEKKDPSLFSWVNLLNCLVSNNLNLFV